MTSKTPWTPGPWIVRDAANHFMIDARDGNVATVNNGRVPQNANAHLIAAAPEMAELLAQLTEMYGSDTSQLWTEARDLLKRIGST